MEAISKEKAASVVLIKAKISEDEMTVYEAALSYALDSLDDVEIEQRFGASVDEIEGMRDDLRAILDSYRETAQIPEPIAKTS
jgi:hypothetical protein